MGQSNTSLSHDEIDSESTQEPNASRENDFQFLIGEVKLVVLLFPIAPPLKTLFNTYAPSHIFLDRSQAMYFENDFISILYLQSTLHLSSHECRSTRTQNVI